MNILYYLATFFFGAFSMVLIFIVLIRKYPDKTHAAFTIVTSKSRFNLPFPSHFIERRILPTGSKVWINDEGRFYLSIIAEYKRDSEGDYYRIEKYEQVWFPTSLVWEDSELTQGLNSTIIGG